MGWKHSLEHNRRNGAVRLVAEQSVVITVSVFTVTMIAYERRNKNIGGTMSKKQISFCGYRCDLCPAYVKNVDTLAKRTTVRKAWNTFFGFDVPEERLLCVGCSKKGSHLDTECPVRPCALSKHVQNCSYCDLFESCVTLRSRADILDETKKKYSGQISKEEYELFFRPYEGRKELRDQRKTR